MARKLEIEEDIECCEECIYCLDSQKCLHPECDMFTFEPQHDTLESVHGNCPLDELEFESEIE